MPAIHRPIETLDRFLREFGHDPTPLAAALAAGFTARQLRAAVDRDLLVRVRHGVLAAPDPRGAPRERRAAEKAEHRVRLLAALCKVGPGAMASHDSAALVATLSSPRAGVAARVELVRPGAANFDGPGLRVRGSGVPPEQRAVVDGIPTTSLVRTAVDLARGESIAAALVPLDAAARRLVTQDEDRHWVAREIVHDDTRRTAAVAQLTEVVETCCGWPGIAAVRRALPHIDPAAESPLESRSRAWFRAAGLPRLHVGYAVATSSGTLWADFCDPERRIIGEADGWSKYGDDLAAVREAIEAEKRRQAELEDDGWRVVRWTTRDSRDAVVSRMASALTRRRW